MLPLRLMMMIKIILIYFASKMMKKKTICAQAVMKIQMTTLSNHADIWFVPTVLRKITVNYVDVDYPKI